MMPVGVTVGAVPGGKDGYAEGFVDMICEVVCQSTDEPLHQFIGSKEKGVVTCRI